ncbi:metal-dependent hydrolase family protein [Pseudoduganella namucuonensis]|uniref:Pro-Hyp dipeptidase. Metallo peptidase. MEROPS family M38 n=1 Tax=Pseudoduganella namucuonensis TaxID=1035707 RepID=A0A1I7JVT6_9BURK|nr:amidohydrolase family protein [Pseudoduganella namucuonensis]SFU89307.1 Pro-Hyp dipeptidase. Metallo peptidase. MEROPS family M38 [Pseudoduganella namucuonensis]
MKLATATVLLSLLAPGAALAAGVILVQAGKLLDRPGHAPRGAATLVVENGKISAVLDGHVGVDMYPGATIVDLRERFVLPGLIDSHVHLVSDRAGAEGALANVNTSPAAWAYEAEMNARKTLAAGFTTVRNLGDGPDGVTLALRDAVNKGWVQGPRILDAGTSISTTAGHMDGRLGYADWVRHGVSDENLCDGVESCRRAVRKQIGRGVDVIKIATTGGVNSMVGAGVARQMFDDEARALIETAHLYGKKVAVHAHGDGGINLALAAGADSIEHGTLLDEKGVQLFLKSGAYYVPTLSTVNGYKERIAANPDAYAPAVRAKIDWRIGITGKSLKLAHARGVKIAFGTDAGVSKHGRNADEFELMVQYGMSPMEAIKAATVNAADLLGVGAQAGTLEAGKSADLIAVAADPLRDITELKRVRFVMMAGAVAKSE